MAKSVGSQRLGHRKGHSASHKRNKPSMTKKTTANLIDRAALQAKAHPPSSAKGADRDGTSERWAATAHQPRAMDPGGRSRCTPQHAATRKWAQGREIEGVCRTASRASALRPPDDGLGGPEQ